MGEAASPEAASSDATGSDDPLAEVHRRWSDAYDDIGPVLDGTGYQAVRRDGKGTVTAGHPADLWDALVRDFAACPVPLLRMVP